MRYLFVFSDIPLNSGFFGFSLRKSTKIFCIYLIFLRLFIIFNISANLKTLFDNQDNNSLYPYVLPTRIVLLINNMFYKISLIMVFISSFSNQKIAMAFLGNIIGSINLLINITINIFYLFIDKPRFDLRFEYFENFVIGYVFIYISIIELMLQYFLHSFCINLLFENYIILDLVQKNNNFEDSTILNGNLKHKAKINIIELKHKI